MQYIVGRSQNNVPAQRPFSSERRKNKRRASEGSGSSDDNRSGKERRLDADWRFALIRRQMNE